MQHQADISLRPSEEQSLRRSEPDGPIRVVVIGAGFAGLSAAQSLSHMQVALTVIDQRNHHLFQPLLYQVATAGLVAGRYRHAHPQPVLRAAERARAARQGDWRRYPGARGAVG